MEDAWLVAGLIRALVSGALAGVLVGTVARILMRLVALDIEAEPAFTWGASLGIVLLFTVSAAGAGAAARFAHRPRLALPAVVVTSLPVLLLGSAIGIGEVMTALDDGVTGARRVTLLVLAAAVLGLACATPYLGWRLGRRQQVAAQPSVA